MANRMAEEFVRTPPSRQSRPPAEEHLTRLVGTERIGFLVPSRRTPAHAAMSRGAHAALAPRVKEREKRPSSSGWTSRPGLNRMLIPAVDSPQPWLTCALPSGSLMRCPPGMGVCLLVAGS
ncbi:hypothetical protein AAFF_G00161760 [Aldrovandia affinis]|uniref:Uncharacterized protein n=1 Tax=Aldrovandia affinis TaxID=143900 RepID=A0AAD7W8N9_9TELE|nr:hypothetical protein AAFF_G00161760 [Aldrovandia affinis]